MKVTEFSAERATDAERFRDLLATLSTESLEASGNYDRDRHALAEIALMLDCALPISVAILDEEQRYVFLNSEAYRLNGFSPEDVKVGSHLSEAHAALKALGRLTDTRIEKAKLAPSLIASRGVGEEDMRVLGMADGRYQRLTRLNLANGYTVSIGEDVTDLVMTNKLLQYTLQQGRSGYWIYDFETKTFAMSESITHILPEDHVRYLEKKGPLPAVHPDDRDEYRKCIEHTTRTGEPFDVTIRAAMPGASMYFRSRAHLRRTPDGRPQRLQCFVQDVTGERLRTNELNRIRDEAVAASMAKSQFLANMSHEIRTPMNGVLGMAELLAGSALDDRQREFVNVITRSATSLLTVINDILDFSKIEADALLLEHAAFSLRDTANEVASLLSQTASDKGIELIVDYPASLPENFIGDGVRVRQVITNLIGNALKFTEHGHVLVKIAGDVDSSGTAHMNVQIVDTGIGIASDKLEHVFDKFTQADNSTTRIYGGTGLGLSISKRLTEMMGGEIAVMSTLGEGTTFSVSLPLPLDKSAKPVVRDTVMLNGKRALIVDDIDVNRRVLSEQMSGWGMSVQAVPDGVEALLALKSAIQANPGKPPFDIIIMDYLMPGVNGRELSNMIHKQPDLDAPILMLSSCDLDTAVGDAGVDRYLTKPVREQALFDAVCLLVAQAEAAAGTPGLNTKELKEDTSLQQSSSAHPAKIDVLVAEDFPLNQDVVRLMLADTRYKPTIVENGQQAVTLYSDDPSRFGAILMDVSMPVMDGYTATGAIREVEATQGFDRTPVIALTGHALTHEREKCISSGMDDYLTKPVKQVELIGTLDRWTGHQSRIAVA